MTDTEKDDLELMLSSLDPLKVARREKLLREIRNEDLKLAVAEGVLMLVEQHRETLSEIIATVITVLDTLPDVMERKLALDGVVVDGLRKEIDNCRDELHLKLMELQVEEPETEPEIEPQEPQTPVQATLPAWMLPVAPVAPNSALPVPSWMLPPAQTAPVSVVDQLKEASEKERPKRSKLKGRPTNAERLMRQLEQGNG